MKMWAILSFILQIPDRLPASIYKDHPNCNKGLSHLDFINCFKMTNILKLTEKYEMFLKVSNQTQSKKEKHNLPNITSKQEECKKPDVAER